MRKTLFAMYPRLTSDSFTLASGQRVDCTGDSAFVDYLPLARGLSLSVLFSLAPFITHSSRDITLPFLLLSSTSKPLFPSLSLFLFLTLSHCLFLSRSLLLSPICVTNSLLSFLRAFRSFSLLVVLSVSLFLSPSPSSPPLFHSSVLSRCLTSASEGMENE